MAESTAPMSAVRLWIWRTEVSASSSSASRRSAAARFWAPLLWTAKMSDLEDLEGRGRPRVEDSVPLVMREESWVVKARVEAEGAVD